MRAAPSVAVASVARPTPPRLLVARLLGRLGDRRYVRRVELASPPRLALEHLRGYFAGARPPANALWAYVAAPAATARLGADASPEQVRDQMLAQWEASLVVGALRDDFCAAGGAPLVGWTVGRGGIGVSDRTEAFEQRFPNPTPAAFRKRVALVARRYGFEIASLGLLRPLQLAPLLVVETARPRKAFVQDVGKIMALLDPFSRQGAFTFEGFFFEAEDAHGPFVRVDNVHRGEVQGGQWSWNPCAYPYPHGGSVLGNRC